jgi:hypothetical protein
VLRAVPGPDYSRIFLRAKQGVQFHTEVTEAAYGEHGDVHDTFSVHSVVNELDHSYQ